MKPNSAAKKQAGKKAAGAGKKAKSLPPCAYSAAEIAEIFRRFAAANPEPKSELEYSNAFTLLVAVVLSAQATDIGVNRATKNLFKLADTAEKMRALGEEEIGRHIKTIGLWRNKAKNVAALAAVLAEQFGGEVPNSREELMQLPGVGRKTANVVLNVVFEQPAMAVDTHIFRLGNRMGLARGKTPEEVERNLLRILPAAYALHAHHWLILHGRYVCKARKPLCETCILADICKAAEKTSGIAAPLAAYRAALHIAG